MSGRNGSLIEEIQMPQVSVEDSMAVLDAEINKAKGTLSVIEQQRQRGLDALAAEKKQWLATVNQHRQATLVFIRRLERAKATLGNQKRSYTRHDTEALADRVVKVLARGPLAQSEIAREVGANVGQVSYAIKVLDSKGTVYDTGQKVGTSRVYSLSPGRPTDILVPPSD